MLQSAIPEHLRQERTRSTKTPDNYDPPFPAYSSQFPKSTKEIVMAILGVQYASEADNNGAAIRKLKQFVALSADNVRPLFWEVTSVIDKEGAYNVAIIAYWNSKTSFATWSSDTGFQKWWQALQPEEERHGWFMEVFYPTVDRFETVFSDGEVPEGAAHMRESVIGPIKEHVYWGSMRDRMPITQTDDLIGESWQSANAPEGSKPETRRRVRVPGRKNLCVIRSGQDWSNTYPAERKLYLDTMHPVLIKGMNFLRDQGGEIGCFSCRFMDVIDPVSLKADKDRTFGLAFFDDMASLEKWSREHKTHLDIFGRFLQYAKELDNNVSLRLFHEVLALKPEQQEFEYIGCHNGTGLLVSLADK